MLQRGTRSLCLVQSGPTSTTAGGGGRAWGSPSRVHATSLNLDFLSSLHKPQPPPPIWHRPCSYGAALRLAVEAQRYFQVGAGGACAWCRMCRQSREPHLANLLRVPSAMTANRQLTAAHACSSPPWPDATVAPPSRAVAAAPILPHPFRAGYMSPSMRHTTYPACLVQDRLEAQPVLFQEEQALGALRQAQLAVAGLVGAEPRDLVFVANATTAVNSVLQSTQASADRHTDRRTPRPYCSAWCSTVQLYLKSTYSARASAGNPLLGFMLVCEAAF